ncbi:hypothetical protein RZS28_12060 [Methylocapsa polymorpha]|uniref:PAS domain-containing protein n=1 Tax=Methylocapsa polymorpha TaxID=3080828 RepID=A0ABZ0HPT1_9HYPH|nr:hypothetical protein RZS28_12060 [Methylocapsa sp. RX1]
MTEFCFAPDLTGQEIAEALRKLPPGLAVSAPVVALGGRNAAHPGRMVFASKALLRLFGARNLDELSDRLFAAAEPGAKRLADLAENLPLDGDPRIEKLRFILGPATQSIIFLCRRVACDDGASLFIAAALDFPESADDPTAGAPSLARENAEEPSPAPRSTEEIPVPPTRSPNEAGVVRFLWRTDAEDRILEVTAPFAKTVGGTGADLVGRNFIDVARRLDAGQGGWLSELMARRRPWSGVEILWPIEGGAAGAPICFGAAPSFDRERRFAGYRGFGIIHLERAPQLDRARRKRAGGRLPSSARPRAAHMAGRPTLGPRQPAR